MNTSGITASVVIGNSLSRLGNYLPQFFGGLVLLLIGLIVAIIVKEIVIRFLAFLKVEDLFEHMTALINRLRSEKAAAEKLWPKLVGELVRWTVVILFLVPAVEIWGLPKASDLLNQFLVYVPNVFVAILIAFVGIIVANLVSEIVRNASRSLGSSSSHLLGTTAKYALFFFTGLVVLNQLGVASDLIRILFTGIVAMVAIAGGLAFGFGGRNAAGKFIDELQEKIEK